MEKLLPLVRPDMFQGARELIPPMDQASYNLVASSRRKKLFFRILNGLSAVFHPANGGETAKLIPKTQYPIMYWRYILINSTTQGA